MGGRNKFTHHFLRKAAANLELAQSRGSLAAEIISELKESAQRTGSYAASAAEAVPLAETLRFLWQWDKTWIDTVNGGNVMNMA